MTYFRCVILRAAPWPRLTDYFTKCFIQNIFAGFSSDVLRLPNFNSASTIALASQLAKVTNC